MNYSDITIETLGREIGMGRNNLYHLLRTFKILRSNNMPQEKYRGLGFFKILHHNISTKNGSSIKEQILLTPKGARWLKKIISAMAEIILASSPPAGQGYHNNQHHSITN